jgi:regulator of sigma E protease
MKIIVGIIAIILSLILVVGIHELGHAIFAKLFNIKIKRISIGFGRPLLSWRGKSDVEWVWSLLPLGGYVSLLDSRNSPVDKTQLMHAFNEKPIATRILIYIAGALFNLILAWFALWCIYMIGFKRIPPVIAQITPTSIAANAGFQKGDTMLQVNGRRTENWQMVGMELITAIGNEHLTVQVQKPSGSVVMATLNMSAWKYKAKETLFDSIGMYPNLEEKPQIVSPENPFKAGKQAMIKLCYLGFYLLSILKQLLTGVLPFAILLGPIGLFAEMINSFLQGIVVYLYFIANLSISLALLNLLPIPGLDGGSILFCCIEKFRGKPLSIPLEILIIRLVSIFAFVFLMQLIMNDLARYFT